MEEKGHIAIGYKRVLREERPPCKHIYILKHYKKKAVTEDMPKFLFLYTKSNTCIVRVVRSFLGESAVCCTVAE